MTSWIVRTLTRLYPEPWRARYEPEFSAFLSTQKLTVATLLDVVWWACVERTHCWRDCRMDAARRSVALMLYAYLLAIVAAVNLYWTVDDTRLAPVMRTHAMWSTMFGAVAIASAVTLAAGAMACLPVLFSMLRLGSVGARRAIVWRLLFPLAALAVLVGWTFVGTMLAGGRWVPTPWDINGQLPVVPPGWPAVHVRWILGSTTGVVLAAGMVGSALTITQALQRSRFSTETLALWGREWVIDPFRAARVPLLVLAGSVVIASVGAVGWGLFAQHYASTGFHDASGGALIGTRSIFQGWIVSLVLFVTASAFAVRGARDTWGSRPE